MKPFLFNTSMVRAILDHRKTLMWLVVKPQPLERPALRMCQDNVWRLEWWNINEFHSIEVPICPGDILYVRETWCYIPCSECESSCTRWTLGIDDPGCYIYKADNKQDPYERWHPSIHMPREAARIFLRVTGVSVTKLRDITEKQAIAGGFTLRAELISFFLKKYPDCTEDSWAWVIEFERISMEAAARAV